MKVLSVFPERLVMRKKLVFLAVAVVTLVAAEIGNPRPAASDPNCFWLDCIDGYSVLCCPWLPACYC